MKSFTSRNPLPIGAIGLVFIIVLLIAAFNASSLPLIGGGTQYTAYFTEAANLKKGDDVTIAGVKVGQVQSVTLDGPRVKVIFTVKNGWVGNDTTAYLKIKTLLGAKYIDLDSQGTRSLNPSHPIPHSLTPFDVYPAFTALTRTVQQINTKQLAQAFNTLSSDFADTPKSVRPVITGLSRLSTTISSRDQQLQTLLYRANQVTGVLAARDQDLQQVLRDGNLLLAELTKRREAIHSLLVNTQVLSAQLEGLVHDNQKTLGPLLSQLNNLFNMLLRNQDVLDRGIALLGPFYRLFNNVIGNGRWFDNYVQNLSVPGIVGLLTMQGSS
jgi:phospholipid/cholesterol/gamma-HCH transport system substrate-binding protein